MSNARTQTNSLQPTRIVEALYHEVPVEHRGWLIRINAKTDTVQVFPPEGDTKHGAFEADLCHLDRVVADFCKLADMPIPGVNKHPKDQVSVGSPKKLLGPDSSVGEGWKNPKVNERPTGLDQKGTKGPNKELGEDSSSKNVPHFDPAVNHRPQEPRGRGGPSDPTLGPDSSSAPANWRDRKVRVQEDGRTGRKALHEVKPPKRGPGQLGYGKAQMGEEAGPEGDGIAARRQAASKIVDINVSDQAAGDWGENQTNFNAHLKNAIEDALQDSFLFPEEIEFRVNVGGSLDSITTKGFQMSAPGTGGDEESLKEDVHHLVDQVWEQVNATFDPEPPASQYSSSRRRADSDPFNVTPVEEPGKKLNKGEDPSDPAEVITTEQGELEKLRTESEGKSARLVDSFARPRVDASAVYRQMMAKRPSKELLRDIMDPHKWAAGNLTDPSGIFGMDKEKEADADAEACSSGADVKAVAPEGWEDTVKDMKKHPEIDNPWALANWEKNKGMTPGGKDKKESRRVAGPRLRENWGGDGAYGRDLEAESAEELHALTLALGGSEVDWSKFKPQMPVGDGEEEPEEQNTQPEGPKAQDMSAPTQAPPVTAKRAGSPGKFKGNGGDNEALAQKLYELVLEGDDGDDVLDFGNSDSGYVDIYNLFLTEGAILHNDDQGFVDVETFTSPEEAQQAWDELKAQAPEEEPEEHDEHLEASPTDEFTHVEDNPAIETEQEMGAGSPVKQGRQADVFFDEGDPEGGDDNSPEALADAYVNSNFEHVLHAIQGDVGLAFSIWEALPGDWKEDFMHFMQQSSSRVASANGKEAVDESAKGYWEKYFGDYGKDLTEEKSLKKPPTSKPTKKNDAKEARREAMFRARKLAQAAAPVAQPAAPQPTPGAPPAKTPAPATPGAPGAQDNPPGGAPKGNPGSTSMPAGTGDQGLQALGWTTEEISLMDESDKKKILQIQLSKPGSGAKPKTPGADKGPSTPSIPPSNLSPTPGPVPAPGVPAPAAPVAPKPSPAVASRLSAMIQKKLANRKALRAQVTPSQSADPNQTPPVGMAPAQQAPAPGAGPTAGPGKSAPGAAATPKAPKVPASGAAPTGEGSSEQEAFDILQQVQQSNVQASSPEQVLSAKVSELARRLLTEVGMTTSDAKQLFGIPSDGGLDKLFQ